MVRSDMVSIMLLEMHRRGTAFWAWSAEEWAQSICPDATSFGLRYGGNGSTSKWSRARAQLLLLAYLLETLPDIGKLVELVKIVPFARKIFGRQLIELAVQRLTTVLQGWGYQRQDGFALTACVCYLFLQNRSPYLEDLSSSLLAAIDQTCPISSVQKCLFQVSRALVALGAISHALPRRPLSPVLISGTDGSVDDAWLRWCQRWLNQSTLQSARSYYYCLLKVGRWLKAHHPEVSSPAQWTSEFAAEFVAAVNNMKVGEWSDSTHNTRRADHLGLPLHPRSKAKLLHATRVFLRDSQEWQWIPGFDPVRHTLFLWEGVTNYLSAEAVDATFRFVRTSAPGSRILFTYVHRDVLAHPAAFSGTRLMVRTLRHVGESWTFGFDPAELPAYLQQRGLLLLADVGSVEYRARYLGQEGHHLHGYAFYRVAEAEVRPRSASSEILTTTKASTLLSERKGE